MKNIRLDVNGSDDKPFPQEENYSVSNISLGEGSETVPSVEQGTQLGQVKYVKCSGAPSIYQDSTRDTADDVDARAKAQDYVDMDSEENEESQGI